MATRSRPSTNSSLVIAAIDFGTTCTGYAYYLRTDTRNYVHDINTEQAWEMSSKMGLQAPTTVLMDPKKSFHSFGFEAENKYEMLTLRNEHKDWYYFRYFKMKLHNEEELNEDIPLETVDGKTMKAMLIFTEAIKYCKHHLLIKLKDAMKTDVTLREITWIITVPAIWRDSAKQFMRQAAEKAGIPSDNLSLALEPESAAIYCKELSITRTEGVEGEFLRAFDPGERYLVIDMGGGTLDTTCHLVAKDGTLEQLHAATGGPYGGELVNDAFEQFIRELVTPKVWQAFCTRYLNYWIEFQKNFEKEKRAFTNASNEVKLNFPNELEPLYKEFNKSELKEKIKKKSGIELLQRSLVITKSVMTSFFTPVLESIIEHINKLKRKDDLKSVSTLLLVGGFSESPIIKDAIKKHFTKLRVIAPMSASVAIIKGAVMYGIDEKIISSRISPCTYGVQTRKNYDPANPRHQERKRLINGGYKVEGVFDKFLEKQESVYIGTKLREKNYLIINRGKQEVFWNVYQSDEKDPTFINDKGCKYIGRLKIMIPDNFKGETELKVSMTCQGTELKAKAIALNGNDTVEIALKFDFFAFEAESEMENSIVTILKQ